MPLEIRLVIFDWAGTTVDFGCFAPVAPFISVFANRGVTVTPAEARVPMGLHKKDHIRQLLQMQSVAERWKSATGQGPSDADVESLFEEFMPRQMSVIDQFSTLVPGLLPTFAWLREHGIKTGGTTGYFRASAEQVAINARRQGFAPDVALCPDDVPAGRPAPWMIFEIMKETGVYPPASVVKIGDTVPDIDEGKSAGAWSVGVIESGSEVGLTESEWTALKPEERRAKAAAARTKLLGAGAHAAIRSVADVPDLIGELNARLAKGEKP